MSEHDFEESTLRTMGAVTERCDGLEEQVVDIARALDTFMDAIEANAAEQETPDRDSFVISLVGQALVFVVCAVVFAAPVAFLARLVWVIGRWAWGLV